MDNVASCTTPLMVFIVSCKIWFLVYGAFLLSWDMLFTYIPATVLGTSAIYCCLNYFRIPLPPSEFVTEVFGEDPNIMVEEYRKQRLGDLSFIPTTSRLASVSLSHISHSNPSLPHLTEESKPYTMWIVGHRGAGLDAPENSLSAFRLCRSRGCLAVEFDVALTKDGVAVIFHDPDLSRIANIERNIVDMTWEELQTVDISINHPLASKYVGERIPTLDEAITTCLDLDLRFFIDLKDPDPKMVDVVLEAYERYGDAMYKRGLVSSFYPSLIYQIRKRNPKVIGCMAWRPNFHEYEVWDGDLQNMELRHCFILAHWIAIASDKLLKWAIENVLWWFIGLSALLLNKDGVTKVETTHWMKKGLRIFVWTVNNPVEKLHLTYNFQTGHLTDTLDGGDLKVVRGTSPPVASMKPNTSIMNTSGSPTRAPVISGTNLNSQIEAAAASSPASTSAKQTKGSSHA